MFQKLKNLLKRYDDWCKSMGLTPDQKRSCVPVKKEDLFDQNKNQREEKR